MRRRLPAPISFPMNPPPADWPDPSPKMVSISICGCPCTSWHRPRRPRFRRDPARSPQIAFQPPRSCSRPRRHWPVKGADRRSIRSGCRVPLPEPGGDDLGCGLGRFGHSRRRAAQFGDPADGKPLRKAFPPCVSIHAAHVDLKFCLGFIERAGLFSVITQIPLCHLSNSSAPSARLDVNDPFLYFGIMLKFTPLRFHEIDCITAISHFFHLICWFKGAYFGEYFDFSTGPCQG